MCVRFCPFMIILFLCFLYIADEKYEVDSVDMSFDELHYL